MSVEKAIITRLDSHSGLKQYVRTRNFAVRYDSDSVYPLTTTTVIGDFAVHAMSADAAVREARIRVSSFAEDFSTCRKVDEKVRVALSRYRGTSGGTVIQDILEITVVDLPHPEVGFGIYQRARDFRVFYEVS